jgi:hypothetical protein
MPSAVKTLLASARYLAVSALEVHQRSPYAIRFVTTDTTCYCRSSGIDYILECQLERLCPYGISHKLPTAAATL